MEARDLIETIEHGNREFATFKAKLDERLTATEARQADLQKAVGAAEININGLLERRGHVSDPDADAIAHKSAPFVAALTKAVDFDALQKFGRLTVNVPAQSLIKKNIVVTSNASYTAGIDGVLPVFNTPSLLDVFETTSAGGASVVQHLRLTTLVDNSAVVSEGALKPESDANLVLIAETGETIAHWVRLTKQLMRDNAAVETYLEGLLLQMVRNKLDARIVAKLNTLAPATGSTATDPLDKLSETIAELEQQGFRPSFVGVSPSDWRALERRKGADGHFLLTSSPTGVRAPSRLWNVPVATSSSLSAGSFILGDAQFATVLLWDEANVQLGTQGDDFVKNIVTMLAEVRAALAVFHLGAFRRGTL